MTSKSPFPYASATIISLLLSLSLLLSHQQRLNWLVTPINFLFSPLRLPFFSLSKLTTRSLKTLKTIPIQSRLITDLERRNLKLSTSIAELNSLKFENEQLRLALKTPTISSRSIIPTRIFALSRFAYIDKGSADLVKPGLPLVADNTLLGLISSTTIHTAKVTIITDPSLVIPVITSNSVSGNLKFINNTLTITDIPSDQAVSVDDRIYTKGSELIPAGLFIGTIFITEPNASSIYQTATIKPALSITDQSSVLVILD